MNTIYGHIFIHALVCGLLMLKHITNHSCEPMESQNKAWNDPSAVVAFTELSEIKKMCYKDRIQLLLVYNRQFKKR